MPYSIRLSRDEERLLAAASRKTGQSKTDLVRQGMRELCEQLVGPPASPYELGRGLFGAGTLARAPRDPMKRAVWEKLHAKHRDVG
jgi:hypothetical protein